MRICTLLVPATAAFALAQSSFSPLRPPAIPLAVKSPYMSTWQQAGSDGGNGGYLPGQWPTFWHGQITGWCGIIRVDNATYTWMGKPDASNPTYANQTSFHYTSTRSIFTFSVGPVELDVVFLSGITPDDLLRSSLPYTYLELSVSSIDGQQHSVQLYTDISAEWVSGDHHAMVEWKYGNIASNVDSSPQTFGAPKNATDTSSSLSNLGTGTSFTIPQSVPHPNSATHAPGQGSRPTSSETHAQPKFKPVQVSPPPFSSGIAYHKVYRQQQLEFSETNQQADWGKWYYSTANTDQLTFQSGADVTVRGNFVNSGTLTNTEDTKYRGIDDDSPVFGFAVELDQVGSSTKSVLFQLSLHQQYCVQFQGTHHAIQQMPCMWTHYFSNDTTALKYFYEDYSNAHSLAKRLDSTIEKDSRAVGGSNYVPLTTLATRQAFGTLEFTNSPTRPLIFMKEISSDGNVNTVDVIMSFHPITIYANPNLLKWVLDPLFINQEAGNWPKAYSIHDIGSNFPNATGHSDGKDEAQPLEECGNMLIMALAYAQRTDDDDYLAENYDILKQWTGYLVNESLIPANQISTDDFAGAAPNQTNLAIKGIIGIEAMAQIANRTGYATDGQMYTRIAHSYVSQWQNLAINKDANPPHTTFNYGNDSSYSLLYSIFSDRELGLQLVPDSVYEMQSDFYPTVFDKYGPPLDSRHTYTKVDWEMWCAAVASDKTQNMFISALATWLNETDTNFAFTDWYNAITGNYPPSQFIARPAVGGVFAPLALKSAPTKETVPPESDRSHHSTRSAGTRSGLPSGFMVISQVAIFAANWLLL